MRHRNPVLPNRAGVTLLVAALLACAAPVRAADLTIGRASEPTSLDPLFARTGNNGDTSDDIFDRLVGSDPNNQITPSLALSWRAVDPTDWEVTLRPNVAFQDGTQLSADDVAFSMERARSVPNSPAPFAAAMRGVTGVEVTGPLSLRVKTDTPAPQLIEQIGEVYIMSRKAAQGLSTTDMNGGEGVVGTGPYRVLRWLPGQRIELERNAAWWGGTAPWDKVTLRFIPQDAGRAAALLSGDVDLIDQVPPTDLARLKQGGRSVFSIASTRLVYLALDSARSVSPFVTDMQGRPLDRNPLQDARVRRAISLMIDRRAIADRLLEGSAEPAGQMVPEGIGGYDPALASPPPDLAAAHGLLEQAGWGGGFGLTVHSSSDRLPQDGAVAQALGQMLRRGGLRVNGVDALPYSVYAAAASRQSYSLFLFSFGTTTSNSAIALTNVLATYDPKAGMGAFNRARYSNPAFDTALRQALAEFDPQKRDALLREAEHIAFKDAAIVPLYWQVVHWAARPGIAYQPRRDEATAARYARPAG